MEYLILLKSFVALLALPAFLVVGSALNRLRGTGEIANSGTLSFLLWFAFLLAVSGNIFVAVFTTLGLYIGSTWGWGVGVGATGGWETEKLHEVPVIDNIASAFFKPVYDEKTKTYSPKWKLQCWGTLWLTLRGLLWGACTFVGYLVGVVATQLWIILVSGASVSLFVSSWTMLLFPLTLFATMGIVYWTVIKILGREIAWNYCEAVYGVFIGLALYIWIL